MRIRRISFRGHAALGDLNLDFTDPATGETFHTVILAGENGSGKTLILDEIFSTLGEFDLNKRLGTMELELELDSANIRELNTKLNVQNLSVKDNTVRVTQSYRTGGSWDNMTV